jgi:hypothetical protein
MVRSTKVALRHALLFISDRSGGRPPDITRDASVWSTPSCVAIGCLSFVDGETKVTMGQTFKVDRAHNLVFDGELETLDGRVVVTTADRQILLDEQGTVPKSRIRIWSNDQVRPDSVIIEVSDENS